MIPKEKVQDIIARHGDLEKELASGKIDPKLFAKKSKEYSDLESIVSYAKDFLKFETELKDLEQIVHDKNSDKEMIDMAEKDLEDLKVKKIYESKLKIFLLPKDEDDDKNAIVEIRAGTGGLEASLFCSDLFKMYEKVCSKKNGNLK